MNHDLMFSSSNKEWETPQDLFDQLNKEFHFELDVCATDGNAKCDDYFTEKDDGLHSDWKGLTCWCNPPYGKGVEDWLAKAYAECVAGGATVVMLLPARTDTKWFHQHAREKHVEIRFLKGRLTFKGAPAPAPFPSLLLIFRPGGKYEFWRA